MHRLPVMNLALVAMLGAAASLAQENQRLVIKLEPVRWQHLPPQVKSICVGPDGRVWHEVTAGDAKLSTEVLRAALEREYREAAPQITVELAVLEPGGRAWFYASTDELWGYDGEKWIERKAAPGFKFTGKCPTLGRPLNNTENRIVSGKLYFCDEQGVHCFDGSEWTYTVPRASENTEPYLPRLAVSPSDKYAVAMTSRTPGRRADASKPDVWLMDPGSPEWKKREIMWSEDATAISDFCVTDAGKLWCVQAGQLRILDLAAFDNVKDRVPTLIAQLDDDNADTRQKAFETLDAIAEQIYPQLKEAQKNATSPEMKRRLNAMVERISGFKAHLQFIAGHGTPLAGVSVQQANGIYQDDQGQMVLSAVASPPGVQRSFRTIMVIDRQGKVQSNRLPNASGLPDSTGRPIFADDRRTVWLTERGATDFVACQIDATLQRAIQKTDTNYYSITAVGASGHAYLRGNNLVEPNSPLGVFSPEFPDSRPILEGETYAIVAPEFLIASDGKVWAVLKDGLSRYDGVRWELIHPKSRGQAHPILAGREGTVLCTNTVGTDFLLFEDNQLTAAAPLQKLIAAYAEKFVAAFPPSYTPVQRGARLWIATDSQKNIWTLSRFGFSVYNGEKWLSMPNAPRLNPGAFALFGRTNNVLTAIGSGSKVFFSKTIAEMKDGVAASTDAPECIAWNHTPVAQRDFEGALWLPTYDPPASKGLTLQAEHRTIRLGEQGPLEEITKNAWPFLVDRSGNVWLARMGKVTPPKPRSHFWIWRRGKIVQELQIPLANDMRGMFSDKPGSVYVWTSLGLHHLIANEAEGSEFRVAQTYALPPVPTFGTTPECDYGDLASMVIPIRSRSLSIFPIPAE